MPVRSLYLRLVVLLLLVGWVDTPVVAQNLLNGSCEPASVDGTLPPSSWTAVGAQPANDFDCDEFTGFGGPAPDDGSTYFAVSQASFPVGAEIYQDVDVTALSGIATGTQKLDFSGAFTVFDNTTGDRMQVILEYRDGGGGVLGSYDIGLQGSAPFDTWTAVTQQVTLPVGTEDVRVRLICNRVSGSTCDGLADNLSLADAGFDPIGVSVSDVGTVTEDAGTADFEVSLSGTPGAAITVNVETRTGTASALDFGSVTTTLTFPAGGVATQTVTVPVVDDALGERDESFTLAIVSVSGGGASIADGEGSATILANDGPVANLATSPGCETPLTDWADPGLTYNWTCGDLSDPLATPSAPGPKEGAAYFFTTGDDSGVMAPFTTATLTQSIEVATAFAASLAAGTQVFDVRASLNIFPGSQDRAALNVRFEKGAGQSLLDVTFGPEAGGGTTSTWTEVGGPLLAPSETERVVVQLLCINASGTTCDAYIDDVVVASASPVTTAENTSPTVTITSPADGTSVESGTSFSFAATASDTEDGDLSASITWSSDLDGGLGTGAAVSTTLTVGTHTVTASVTDSGAPSGTPLSGSSSIQVTVRPECPLPRIVSRDLDGVNRRIDLDLDAGQGVTLSSVNFVDTDRATRYLKGLTASLLSGGLSATTGDYLWDATASPTREATFRLQGNEQEDDFGYFVEITNSCGEVAYVDPKGDFSGLSSPSIELPSEVTLAGSYPNPFNPQATIRFGLPEASEVRLAVYDVTGREVAVLISGETRASGWHEARFDAQGLPSGVYLYRLQAAGTVQTGQMTLLK